MKMKLLAMAVMATACGSNVFAAEVYNSGDTTLSIGGHVSVGVGEYNSSDEVEVHSVSPRVNIAGKQELSNGFSVDAKGEWALNYLNGGKQSFTTRLGYIGASHDVYGRVVLGTQWSPYYDVAGVTDLPIAFANDFLYDDQYHLGTARAEKMLSYRNALSLGEFGKLSLGLGWQGEHSKKVRDEDTDAVSGEVTLTDSTVKYDMRTQVAVSYMIETLNLGYAYNIGDVERPSGAESMEERSHAFSLSGGEYGNGLYGAAVYTVNDELNGKQDANEFEILMAYGLDYGLNVILNYEEEVDSDDELTQFSQAAIQLEYTVTPKFMGFAGYQFDMGNDIDKDEEDFWTIGARYFL